MIDMKGGENLLSIVAFLMPGMIILYFRSMLITGRMATHTEALLSYFAITIFYYSIIFVCSGGVEFWRSDSFILRSFIIFIFPAFIGILFGAAAQYSVGRKLLRCIKLNSVHPSPTAWDWKFSRISASWVVVTLKNDTIFRGYLGPESFISSSDKERDIYIQRLYDLGENDVWKPAGEAGDKGLLITSGEVRTIEFIPIT